MGISAMKGGTLVQVQLYTVRFRYNTVNFLTNIHKRHHIARPSERGMGCLLWVQLLIDILPEFLKQFIQYLIILDRVITILECIIHPSDGMSQNIINSGGKKWKHIFDYQGWVQKLYSQNKGKLQNYVILTLTII